MGSRVADAVRWHTEAARLRVSRGPNRAGAVLAAARGDWFFLTCIGMLLAIAVVALAAPLIAPHDPVELTADRLAEPSSGHLFGTDEFGRDVLSRVIRWQAWGKPDIKDTSAWERHVAYRRFRTPAVREVLGLLRETRSLLPGIHQPLLIIQARHDNIASSS